MYELKNVSFHYANGEDAGAIKNINLSIKAGEAVLICGESGCGKTTLLRLLNGLIPNYFEGTLEGDVLFLSLIHISEPTRQEAISYAVFCLKKKK